MASGVHIPQRIVAKIVALGEEGVTIPDIAARFGVTREAVRSHLITAKVLEPTLSDPVPGYGEEELAQARRDLLRRARTGDPDAIGELTGMGVTGWWIHGEGTIISRRGFNPVTCMVP